MVDVEIPRRGTETLARGQNSNVKTFGKFEEINASIYEYLQIGFSPSSICLQQRWRNNGLSADFLADYMSTFFPGDDAESLDRRSEVKDAVSFIANELLENAMKYNYGPAQKSVNITMKLHEDHIIFYISNAVDPKGLEDFYAFIQKMLTEDPHEMYLEQLLANADDEENGSSGVGFLTMINDYNAILGWRFWLPESELHKHMVTTMVRLSV